MPVLDSLLMYARAPALPGQMKHSEMVKIIHFDSVQNFFVFPLWRRILAFLPDFFFFSFQHCRSFF